MDVLLPPVKTKGKKDNIDPTTPRITVRTYNRHDERVCKKKMQLLFTKPK